MAKLRIQGDTSGYVDLEAPAYANSSTINLNEVTQLGSLLTENNGLASVSVNNEALIINRNAGDPYLNFQTNGTNNGVVTYGGASTGYRIFTNAGESFKVDHSGYVTVPNQPFIACVGNSNSNIDYSANSVMSHWTDRSTPIGITRSGGRFTVPVAGKYQVNMCLYAYPNTDNHYRWYLRVNGGNHSLAQIELTSSMFRDTQYDLTVNFNDIISLSAGDYIEVFNETAMRMFGGNPHNSFSMMLIG